ncbi:class II aldolase and adducin N-terminal domain-containing protein [Methylovirgula sp. 4M-Z18]|uniref:class II aldolase and adducin N-terminal domain-containing protein n=1 Tax=Methylovirgula sp. 4M-Z18 TaxID=2293567 RepID=UPI000E2F8464|nr:class II aldolase and adducin N-terminal domain-containing protein [Methylovirgula sp. 4M-Z18]RFB75550.1 hypothetical protein DYH55_22060 [Methylovirgula sp. 4M-Z18]
MTAPSEPFPGESQGRIDLAAAFRLAVHNGWHEAVANHFSLAVSPDGRTFLMNPKWRHFSRIRASDLLRIDARDPATMQRPDAPDPSAWSIHGALHRHLPQARCVLHVHSPYATALASLADPSVLPIDQNSARYFNRVAFDLHYGGIADQEAEGERLAKAMGNKSRMLMGNHGVIITAPTVAEAFDDLYYFERACKNLILAHSTGRPLSVLPDEVAEQTACSWEDYADSAFAHFNEMKQILDAKEPDYAQ